MRADVDLLHGDALSIAEFLGVAPRTVKRWKAGRVALPEPCRKLLRLRFEGDASALLGNGWEGFYFQRGELFIPGWRYGFNPDQIRGMFFEVQEVRALRRELRQVREDMLGREFVWRLVRGGPELGGERVGLDIRQHGHRAD